MKHLKHFLLAMLVALLGSVPVRAHDFEAVNDDGVTIYYNITSEVDRTCSVTFRGDTYGSYNDEYSGTVNIPASARIYTRNYKVTAIGEKAFYGCCILKSVSVPGSVLRIEDDAFNGCSALEYLELKDGEDALSIGSHNVKYSSSWGIQDQTQDPNEIPWRASGYSSYAQFYSCPLKYVYIGRELKYEKKPFESVKEVTLSDNLTEIPSCLSYNSSLTSVKIGGSIAEIGNYAFYYCTALSSITIPINVSSIGYGAFYKCTALESIQLSKNLQYLDHSAFEGCSALTSIEIPNSLTIIGDNTFSGCSKLSSIVLPNSVTSIGSNAFEGCSVLSSIVLPNSLTSIGEYFFKGCESLTNIEIPNSVTSIGNHAFSGCTGLASIKLPSSLKSISYYAFEGCSALASIVLPNSLTSIGDYSFKGCKSFTTIEIPNSVSSIGNYAFSGCI